MGAIRVLVVDDSAVIRKVLGDLLGQDPAIEVVGSAPNGKVALEKLSSLNPDIITLDIEMPEMNGLDVVREIRQRGNQVPIIMCSSLTADGASHTLDALALGASDYVTKPSSHGVNTRDVVGDDLLRKIKALAKQERNASGSSSVRTSSLVRSDIPREAKPDKMLSEVGIVAFGVSTGGPNALMELLPQFSATFPVPIVIVQHMPPLFTKMLALRLCEVSKLPVSEAQHSQEVLPGQVYLAPGGFHMEIKRLLGRTVVALNDGPAENSCRPAVDVLFRSVAKTYGDKSLGVILTGMGQDGLNGAKEIKRVGGSLIIQDKESSAVWGMPGSIIDAGLEPYVSPLNGIAQEIERLVTTDSSANKKTGTSDRKVLNKSADTL
jgi:two-component system chemotaxis response regulator CheB